MVAVVVEVVSIATGANVGIPLIVLKGRAVCDVPLDLPLLTRALGDNSMDSSAFLAGSTRLSSSLR